ncbi:TolC family protein [Hyphomonas sp.]|uniref:TolC family protein n=1 Tax=Hyphomonas sp. TaxID=87 RepID=UPI000E05C995|nr:TolC family protein [Hyphomonas sp.]RCL90156.1 MAG: TolC family protein [Hyphomonas sp.]
MSLILKGSIAALTLSAISMGANASPCDGGSSAPSQITAGEPLTLRAVLTEVRQVSPTVRAAGLETRALNAEADQASRWLNPSLSLELENFSGSGALSGFDQTETTFAIEQTFRLGGKRSLTERAARARQALASAECTLILRETEMEAAISFAELVAAVELVELTEDSAALADQLADTVERRVEAGAAAPPELSRAQADAAILRASVETAKANVEQKKYALALLWGSAEPVFSAPKHMAIAGPDIEAEQVRKHPALEVAEAELRKQDAERDLARSSAMPDVTVSAGVRRFEETGDEALVAGLSVPLPLFDRGRDQVRASTFRGEAAALGRAATEQRLLAAQRSAVATLNAAQNRLDILNTDALPAAQEAYDAALRGYEVGRFDLTTTLNARSALLDTRLAVIDAGLALRSEDLRLRALIGAAPFDGDNK